MEVNRKGKVKLGSRRVLIENLAFLKYYLEPPSKDWKEETCPFSYFFLLASNALRSQDPEIDLLISACVLQITHIS